MNYETICFDAITGERTVVPWTDEQIAAYEADALAFAWDALRTERNTRLSASDIYVLPDRWDGYNVETKAIWTAYRQALRNLPQTTLDPSNPDWPVRPGEQSA